MNLIFTANKLFGEHILAIAIYPLIFVKNKEFKYNQVLINHEKIHLKQQAELFVIPFYIWYIIEYIIGLAKYKDSNKAYHNICFEREAYANEKNLNYLQYRRKFSFLRYKNKAN